MSNKVNEEIKFRDVNTSPIKLCKKNSHQFLCDLPILSSGSHHYSDYTVCSSLDINNHPLINKTTNPDSKLLPMKTAMNGDVVSNNNNNDMISRNPPWWNRRTRLERALVAVAAIALVMCTSMMVALLYVGYNYQLAIDSSSSSGSLSRIPPEAIMLVKEGDQSGNNGNQLGNGSERTSENTCLSSGCVRAAADFLRNMDPSVDPCNDFYRFSCGSWVDSQVIADDRTSVSIFSLLQDDLNNKLRGEFSLTLLSLQDLPSFLSRS